MYEPVLVALTPCAVLLAGLLLFCLPAYARRARVLVGGPWLSILTAAGAVLSLLGLFAVAGVLSNVMFGPAWIILTVLLSSALQRYRDAERRSLLWSLMVAAERGIPLESAARSFAEERYDGLGARALAVADYLEAGLPLAAALQRSRLPLPLDLRLAADLGQQTGELGPALRRVLGRVDEFEILRRATREKLSYLGGLVAFSLLAWSFICLKIVPAYQKILSEFGVLVPAVTRVFIEVSNGAVRYWFVPVPILAWLVWRFWRRRSQSGDRSVILRWLAIGVRTERPIPEMLQVVADSLPRRKLQAQLRRAAGDIEGGAEWCEALRHAGLVRRAEAAVLQAAGRAGNLAWALDELADSSVRRAAYRLRALLNVAFPLVLLGFGTLVGSMALALLIPLITLIQRLT